MALHPDTLKRKKSYKSLICRTCLLFGCSWLCLPAEREGFEPPEPRSSTVFKTAAIDHSAISPMLLNALYFLSKAMQMYVFFLLLQTISPTFIFVFHNRLSFNIYYTNQYKTLTLLKDTNLEPTNKLFTSFLYICTLIWDSLSILNFINKYT